MKKYSVITCVFLLFAIWNIGKQDKQRLYVKNMTLGKTENSFFLKLVYYDFSQREETFETKTYYDSDMNKLAAKAMNDNNYNFRLCETAFLSPWIFESDINKAVYLMNSLKISPSTNVVFREEAEEKSGAVEISCFSPLYNLSGENGAVNGCMVMLDGNGKENGLVLIRNGTVTDVLNSTQSAILGIITGLSDSEQFSFYDGSFWVNAEKISTAFSVVDNELNISVDLWIKERKGIAGGLQSEKIFDWLLEKEISNTIYDLYENIHVNRLYNLHWYCEQRGKDCTGIKTKITIR